MKQSEKLKSSEIRKSNLENVKGGCGNYNCIPHNESTDEFGFICRCGNRDLALIQDEDGLTLTQCVNCGQIYCN